MRFAALYYFVLVAVLFASSENALAIKAGWAKTLANIKKIGTILPVKSFNKAKKNILQNINSKSVDKAVGIVAIGIGIGYLFRNITESESFLSADNTAVQSENQMSSDDKISFKEHAEKLKLVAYKITEQHPGEISEDTMWQLSQDKELQKSVIRAYFRKNVHKNRNLLNNSEAQKQFWQQIFAHISLEEMYAIKDQAKLDTIDFELSRKIDEMKLLEEYKMRTNKKMDSNASATEGSNVVEYRKVALEYGLKVPDWIHLTTDRVFVHDDHTFVRRSDGVAVGKVISIQENMKDKDMVGILFHEVGHCLNFDYKQTLILNNEIQQSCNDDFCNENRLNQLCCGEERFNYMQEYAADRFACFRSNEACNFIIQRLKNDVENGDNGNKWNHTHPSKNSRIKNMRKILEEKEKVKQGLCKNPFYKNLGSAKWFDCKVASENKLSGVEIEKI